MISTTSDDAPSAVRATTDDHAPQLRTLLRPYWAGAVWAFLGAAYLLWLAESIRTGDELPGSQLNAAILTVISLGVLVTWPRRATAEVARLAGEVHALSERLEVLESALAGLPSTLDAAGEDIYAAGYVDGVRAPRAEDARAGRGGTDQREIPSVIFDSPR
jgi:hypothetical protein